MNCYEINGYSLLYSLYYDEEATLSVIYIKYIFDKAVFWGEH